MAGDRPPTVKINTFIKNKKKRLIDHVSKLFLFFEFFLGLNRIPVFGNILPIHHVLSFLYFMLFNSFFLYLNIVRGMDLFGLVSNIKLIQLYFCSIFGYISCKRLRRYYDELDKFDAVLANNPRIPMESIIIVVQTTGVAGILLFLLIKNEDCQYIGVYMIHTLEYNYYGHLICLLIQRLREINSCLCTSTSRKDHNTVNITMSKLADLYHIVINAYDYVVDAVKWQFLVMLTSLFAYLLMNSYTVAHAYITQNIPFVALVSDIIMAFTEMIPLLATCMCCDLVRFEVCRLRELLASKLYENKIDKSSRGTVRALLALTETRNLSFVLLRMVDISISLPFTFLGLLVTYLIIMLQFQKVIFPND